MDSASGVRQDLGGHRQSPSRIHLHYNYLWDHTALERTDEGDRLHKVRPP